MVFTQFVEVGRVALITYGPLKDKLCTIVCIVDGNRVLIDGPRGVTGVARQVINVKRISLTDIVVEIAQHAPEKDLKEAWKTANVLEEFKKSSQGRKLTKQSIVANMNDFDRFKLASAKKIRATAIRKKVASLRK